MNQLQTDYGDRNIVGRKIVQRRLEMGMKQYELLALLQSRGLDIALPSLSLLEGQKRSVTDIELKTLAEVLKISTDELLDVHFRGWRSPSVDEDIIDIFYRD